VIVEGLSTFEENLIRGDAYAKGRGHPTKSCCFITAYNPGSQRTDA
jgi:hypothetical protein